MYPGSNSAVGDAQPAVQPFLIQHLTLKMSWMSCSALTAFETFVQLSEAISAQSFAFIHAGWDRSDVQEAVGCLHAHPAHTSHRVSSVQAKNGLFMGSASFLRKRFPVTF